ncbi:hypothetical protein HG531_000055 [Fusarium graminearum]|nr:hypothetical protein HG531_000055 [Fusarium graminearum]
MLHQRNKRAARSRKQNTRNNSPSKIRPLLPSLQLRLHLQQLLQTPDKPRDGTSSEIVDEKVMHGCSSAGHGLVRMRCCIGAKDFFHGERRRDTFREQTWKSARCDEDCVGGHLAHDSDVPGKSVGMSQSSLF